jgi:Protein of unknown function (DUF1616)
VRLARRGESRDLSLVVAALLVSLLLLALPFGGLPKAILLLPLVLFLPGYALSAALFPPGALPPAERAIYSVALSIATAVLAGLLWQFAFALTRTSWALLLAAITLAGCAVAQGRRGPNPHRSPSRNSPIGASPWPRLDLPTAVTVLLGVAAAIAAIAIATDGLQEQRAKSHFSALWVVPRTPGSEAVEIGIQNHQGSTHVYRLEVEAAGRDIHHWRGRLASRANKRLLLAPGSVPSGMQLIVSLFRDGALYRRVETQAGTGT